MYPKKINREKIEESNTSAVSAASAVSAVSSVSGFSLVSAIFVIVILALIGTYIVSISALTRASGSLMIQGVKAYYAAKSGLEWGVYQVAPLVGSPPFNCPPSPTTLTLSQGGVAGFSAIVTCTQNSFNEGNMVYNTFQIQSLGQYGVPGGPDYASRVLYTTVIQAGV